jgi:nucleotide-binding universal stress UspA family protein
MFRRILVPVDFTPKSLRAVRAAARVAGSAKASTTLLHVIERVDDGDPGAFRAFYRKLEKNAREKLSGLSAALVEKALPVKTAVVYGNRVNEILRFAGQSSADLIVMSSHRLPLHPRGQDWGTISYKVGALSRCPVLLVK